MVTGTNTIGFCLGRARGSTPGIRPLLSYPGTCQLRAGQIAGRTESRLALPSLFYWGHAAICANRTEKGKESVGRKGI